jgi:hypothetical protein
LSALRRAFELVLGVDEEAAEGHDLITLAKAVEYLRIELALDAGLDLLRLVLPFLPLDLHDVLVALFDN